MPKPVKNYIVLVDAYRRPSRRRNTAGRYKVGAKTPQEAEKILRKLIGFGDVKVYYESTPDYQYTDGPAIGYKEAVKIGWETVDGKRIVIHLPVLHAGAPRNE